MFTASALFRLKQGYFLTDDPCSIWNILMFSPSLFCETSAFSFCSSYSTTTMTSADFLTSFHLSGPPLVRAFSFLRSLQHLHNCPQIPFGLCNGVLTYPKQLCLICRSCSSVPDFAVWLPSLLPSPATSLPLANTSGINPAYKGLTPSGTYTLL